MNKDQNFIDKVVTNKVIRRDYSKINSNFEEPNLLNLQKKSFKRFIENDLEEIIKNFFPIKSIGGRYSLEFNSVKLEKPKRTEKQARNEGKTYDRPLYVNLSIIDHESGEVKLTPKNRAKNSDGIFFSDIPIMTEKGTFIVNGIEKFVISQIVRSPGPYILTKSQIKLSNSRKRVQEGYVCEVLPSKGTLFFVFISETKKYVQIMFRDAIGESTCLVPITTFLKAIGMDEIEILKTFDDNFYIKESLKFEKYNVREILDFEDISSIYKGNASSSIYGIDNKLKLLIKDYRDIEKDEEIKEEEKNLKLNKILTEIITEKAAKDLVNSLSISTKNIDAKSRIISKDLTCYQMIIFNHFFNVKNYDLSKAGRYKMERKMRVSERLYQRILAEDILDGNKVLIKKDTLIQKEELDLLKKHFSKEENNLSIYENIKISNELKNTKMFSNIEKVKVYTNNEDLVESIPVIGSCANYDHQSLTISDILSITSYIINLSCEIGYYDDIDHLGNKRLKLIHELLKTRAQAGLTRIEKFVNDKLAIADGANKTNDIEIIQKSITVKSIINTKPFKLSFKEFFNSHQLTQFLDQQNPLAELTNKRRISAMGPGGISREDPNLDIRDVHYSHYGKICPIETPEGMNIGLIMSLASYANCDDNGFLHTPYRKVKNGTILYDPKDICWLTALQEDEYVIACSNLNIKNDKFLESKVLCRYRGSLEFFEPNKIDFIDISPKQVVSIAASSIPFLENDDANRALMGANMQRQATPLIKPIAPIVGTGNEYKIAKDSGMALVYTNDEPGVVKSVTSDKIIVETKKGNEEFELIKFNKSNQNTCNNQVPIVSVGDKISKEDILADGPSMSNGELALGQNVLVGFTTWSGYNYEDAIILSKRLFNDDIFTSIHIVEYSIECIRTKNGDEEITRDIPNVGDAHKVYLDDEGIIMVGADVKEGDVLVGKISPKGQVELSAEEKLLEAIFGSKSKNFKDSSLKIPHGGEGTVGLIKRFKVQDDYELDADVIEQIKIYVVQKRKIQIGDKMAGRHGNKGIISKIVAIEDMPHLEDGTPLDIMLNPLGVPSRMNIGQILEIHLGLAMRNITLHKLLELVLNDSPLVEFQKYFGINETIAKTLVINFKEILNSKKIKTIQEAKTKFNELDYSIVLNKSGMNRDEIIYKVSTPIFEGVTKKDLEMIMDEAGISPITSQEGYGKNGKFKLIDGRTGEYFDGNISIGVMYMLKLDHMVDDKIHSRAVGPYSKITQQPLGGKSQNGGQRFGEMEVWALEAYGAAYNLRELLTIKSDDVKGRNNTYNAIIKGKPIPEPGIPESFKLLTKQLQGLGLQVNITKDNKDKKDINTYISNMTEEFIKQSAEAQEQNNKILKNDESESI